MAESRVTVATEEGIRVAILVGDFVGGEETDALREMLARESREGTGKLLIDLAGAAYLNSTALGALIGAHTNFAKRGARIGLCNLSGNVENIFEITRLTLVFNIYRTREEGIAGMSRDEVTRGQTDGYINRSL